MVKLPPTIITDSTREDDLIAFSESVLNHSQRLSEYFEEKKYKFLTISIAFLGFGATFASIFSDKIFLVAAALFLTITAVISALIYSNEWSPTIRLRDKLRHSLRFSAYNIDPKKSIDQNYEIYRKKFMKLTEKGIIEDNVAQIVSLFYVYDMKWRTIRKMRLVLLIGIIGFFILICVHTMINYYPL